MVIIVSVINVVTLFFVIGVVSVVSTVGSILVITAVKRFTVGTVICVKNVIKLIIMVNVANVIHVINVVRELMGWVRNVVLIKCIFGSGKPKGGPGFWVGGYMGQMGNRGVSLRATWERGGRILSQKEGSK